MGKKDIDINEALARRERFREVLDMARSGALQEVRTATGEVIQTGRPPMIETVEQLNHYIRLYYQDLDERNARLPAECAPIFPDLPGFWCFIGIARGTWSDWLLCKPSAFTDAMKTFEASVLTVKQQLGLAGDLATIPLMADLNNNHGYTNAPQVVRHEYSKELPTLDDISRRLPGDSSGNP